MFFDFEKYTYYVAPGGTDMRKGADSLARLIWQNMSLDAHSRNMFLFCMSPPPEKGMQTAVHGNSDR